MFYKWFESNDIDFLKQHAEKEINTIDYLGSTKLTYASLRDNIPKETFDFLLSVPGVDVNHKARTYGNSTPLHLACDDFYKVIRLVEAGADVNAVDNNNQTPLMMSKNEEVIKYLSNLSRKA